MPDLFNYSHLTENTQLDVLQIIAKHVIITTIMSMTLEEVITGHNSHSRTALKTPEPDKTISVPQLSDANKPIQTAMGAIRDALTNFHQPMMNFHREIPVNTAPLAARTQLANFADDGRAINQFIDSIKEYLARMHFHFLGDSVMNAEAAATAT